MPYILQPKHLHSTIQQRKKDLLVIMEKYTGKQGRYWVQMIHATDLGSSVSNGPQCLLYMKNVEPNILKVY